MSVATKFNISAALQCPHPGRLSVLYFACADTGIQFSHPDLAPHMWVNPGEIPGNGVDDDGNGRVDDICECVNAWHATCTDAPNPGRAFDIQHYVFPPTK